MLIIEVLAYLITIIILISPALIIAGIIYLVKKKKKTKHYDYYPPQAKERNPAVSEWEFNPKTERWEPKDKSRIIKEQEQEWKPPKFDPNNYDGPIYRAPEFEPQRRKEPKEQPIKYQVPKKETANYQAPKKEPIQNDTKKYEPPKQEAPKYESEQDKAEILDYSKAYQRKYIFTKNELAQYKTLKQIADVKGYVICPKVRLLDIVEPRKGIKKYMTYFYKVQAKHVDFVICDQGMHIKAIIELDDASHDTPERIERDKMVDKILRSVGYCVIHTRYITNDILDTV